MTSPPEKISRNVKRSLVIVFIFCALIMLIILRWQQQKQEYTFAGSVMGTTYHIKYISKRLSSDKQKAIAEAVSAALHRVDNEMTTYKMSSELMKLNAWPVNKPFHVSKDLAQLLNASFSVSALSGGAYDVTVGPLVNLWGFGPDIVNGKVKKAPDFIRWQDGGQQPDIPSSQAIAVAKNEVGYQYIIVDIHNLTVTKKRKLFIDLSSIAKGYGVDQAAEALEKMTIDNYMVEVGGEVHVGGYRLNYQPWRIAIRSPEENTETPYKVLRLDNEGMATSGDYLNYYDVNHTKYSHEINPKTGYPEQNNIASVTVIAKNTTMADAYATMFMILKPNEGQQLAKQHSLAVYIIYRNEDNKGFSSFASPSFTRYMQKGVST